MKRKKFLWEEKKALQPYRVFVSMTTERLIDLRKKRKVRGGRERGRTWMEMKTLQRRGFSRKKKRGTSDAWTPQKMVRRGCAKDKGREGIAGVFSGEGGSGVGSGDSSTFLRKRQPTKKEHLE